MATISISFVGSESKSTMLAASLLPGQIHCYPNICLGWAGASLVPSPVIATQFALCLFSLNHFDFVFRRRFRNEVIHPSFSSNYRSGNRLSPVSMIVRTPPPQLVKAFTDTGFKISLR